MLKAAEAPNAYSQFMTLLWTVNAHQADGPATMSHNGDLFLSSDDGHAMALRLPTVSTNMLMEIVASANKIIRERVELAIRAGGIQ